LRMLSHPPSSFSGPGGAYPNTPVLIMPSVSGGGRPPSSAPSDKDSSPYKRKQVIDEPYSQEPGALIDPAFDDGPVGGDDPPPLPGDDADDVDVLGLRQLPPIDVAHFGAVVRLPSCPNGMPSLLAALGVGREGGHQGPTPVSVREGLVCASAWVGLALPA